MQPPLVQLPKRFSVVLNKFASGNEADIDSNCSSIATSRGHLDHLRWKSVYSIGYENEYEFNNYSSDAESALSHASSLNQLDGAFVPKNPDFLPIDDAADEEILDARGQVYALARDIQKNFGDYQLSRFSDVE